MKEVAAAALPGQLGAGVGRCVGAQARVADVECACAGHSAHKLWAPQGP